MKNRITQMTSREVAEAIAAKPLLIVPIAPLEPIGDLLPLGALSEIVTTVAEKVAENIGGLCAPIITPSFNMPFKAFSGTVTVKKNTFKGIVADIARTALLWGVETVVFIDGSYDSSKLITQALHEYRSKLPKRADELGEDKITLTESDFRWMHNEDAMATEKLAEGIRNFTVDTLKLEELVKKLM